jgi:hypothetical protein
MQRLGDLTVNTLTAITGNGRHYYFTSEKPVNNSSGRLGEGIDVRGIGGYVVGVGSKHVNGARYKWADPDHGVESLPQQLVGSLASPKTKALLDIEPNSILEGQRNTTLASFAGVMRRRGMAYAAIKAALMMENRYRCVPPLPKGEVTTIAASISRYTSAPAFYDWPVPLEEAAFCGLAGEVVNAFTPHSEVDPAGLLGHTLTFFGNAAGSRAYFPVASDRHGTNIYTVTVGETAKARKGVAFNHEKQLFLLAAPEWTTNCIETGLSSGEGLIRSILERSRVEGSNGSDPRLLIFEPEFGLALRVMQRQGNTLSPVLRQGWDSTPLGVLTRKEPLKAKSSHISLIGHITKLELRDLLTRQDIFGGLANRILWICVRRHGMHAELRGVRDDLLRPLAEKMKSALATAKQVKELRFSTDANQQWKEIYPALSSEDTGLLGAVVSRAEAQVLRLAGIYSLMDKSHRVRRKHLEAALSLWRYCRDSAAVIFGTKQSVLLEDQILKLLNGSPHGMTRTEISAAFNNHKSAPSISEALGKLQNNSQARTETTKTDGRPAERWFPVTEADRR